jgi:hypothetical protein
MNDSLKKETNYAVGLFFQHVVPIQLRFRRDKETKHRIITSFVMSVQEQWLLVTAGHCIRDVRQNEASGWALDRTLLIDSIGMQAKHDHPVPFDWRSALPSVPFEDEANDFGLLLVDDFTRRQLEVNGVRAITEQAWDFEPGDAFAYLMVGAPSTLAQPAEPISRLTAVVAVVRAADQRPADLEETEAERWYGFVGHPEGLSDIDGMSGGPILGLRKNEAGELKYWLHAIQSAWHRPSRAIAACPMRPLGRFLSEVIDGVHEV